SKAFGSLGDFVVKLSNIRVACYSAAFRSLPAGRFQFIETLEDGPVRFVSPHELKAALAVQFAADVTQLSSQAGIYGKLLEIGGICRNRDIGIMPHWYLGGMNSTVAGCKRQSRDRASSRYVMKLQQVPARKALEIIPSGNNRGISLSTRVPHRVKTAGMAVYRPAKFAQRDATE